VIPNKEKLINDGYLKTSKHPTEELYTYNYTQLAQFDKKVFIENPVLMECRGLILDKDDNVIARPFKKFFNYEEYGEGSVLGVLPDYKSFEVYDKLDGSLGILYPTSKGLAIATRGSFVSEQALWATNYLNNKHKDFQSAYFNKYFYSDITFLFEILYKENRIVVDYDEEGIILLSIIDNKTGEDWSRAEIESIAKEFKFSIVKKFDGVDDFEKIRDTIKRNNAEGFVIKFDNGLRVKLKYEDYVRLHRLVTGVSTKSIWEMLKNGDSFEDILECVPDEFHKFVLTTKNELEIKFKRIEHDSLSIYLKILPMPTRKEQAIYIINNHKNESPVVFQMLDRKDYKNSIWKMIEPKYKQPFKDREGN
jgi:RNA ligase